MAREWTADEVLRVGRDYQQACVLAAAADLDVFGALSDGPMTADAVAARLGTDPRGTTVLLDALAAMELLDKQDDGYCVPPSVADVLAEAGSHSVLAMARHHANCLRRWAQLATVVRNGGPAERLPSVCAEGEDLASFVGGMHDISAPVAGRLIASIQPLAFRHLLDVGGASGTWTLAFLDTAPEARATLFDLPQVIPMAERRIADAGMADRVRLVPGDFYADPLPGGADLAWLGAIVHQNSREQNRELFAKVHAALVPGGRILIRDLLMEPCRTRPVGGALFAINMLVATQGGGTFTFDELHDDLLASGFKAPELLRRGEWMDSVVSATKPGTP